MITKEQAQFINSADIKHRLIDRQLSVSALAKRIKKSRTAVSLTVNGSQDYPHVMKRIRRALDV